ncbi:MAG: sugar phosphate isomerase/epimerase family protein [Aeoliella sp.]
MSIVRIGIQTRSLRQPLRRALDTAAELGADGVEIDLRTELPVTDLSQTALRQFRKLLDDHGLQVSAVSYPTRRGYDDSNDLERRLQGTRRAMKAAADLGAKVVVNRIAHDLPDPADERREVLLHALTSLGMEGNRVGANISILTSALPAEDVAELLGEIPDRTVGVSFHPAGLLAAGESPVDALGHLGRYVTHVHACDAVSELGTGGTVEVELGRGSADLPAILAELEAHDYRGWTTIERNSSAEPITDIGNAVTYLRKLGE